MTTTTTRDHGGGLDAAAAQWGGRVEDWIDLSTGINPVPYPVPDFSHRAWTALPDQAAFERLERAARLFWSVPKSAAFLAAPGASSIIAQLPFAMDGTQVSIPQPTYNEHEAAFTALGWDVRENASARVVVHPNNPDGRLWTRPEMSQQIRIIDESFCDVTPTQSLIEMTAEPGTLVLKSFGKFWGLGGLRLGFAIGDPAIIQRLRQSLGPWQVSGPALELGARALEDEDWAVETRRRLSEDAQRLDDLVTKTHSKVVGGTDLFRLYETDDAKAFQDRLARHIIWSRIFPYSKTWVRLGIPAPDAWDRLEDAL